VQQILSGRQQDAHSVEPSQMRLSRRVPVALEGLCHSVRAMMPMCGVSHASGSLQCLLEQEPFSMRWLLFDLRAFLDM